MKYISTRNKKILASGAEAIVKGISREGGLFVPESFPSLSPNEIKALSSLSYPERAAKIIELFLPELKDSLLEYTSLAYSSFDEFPAPLVNVDNRLYFLELWHGATYAFKDIALSLLPHLLVGSKKKLNKTENTLILVATSGDTGKAAIEGFKNIEGASVLVLYPTDGVSNLQKLQMQTSEGNNIRVYGIEGNFDDAQSAVKEIFSDKNIEEKLLAQNTVLSSANSINIGRLIPQIVYYFSSYVDMVSAGRLAFGEEVNFCVPTGNFGNILAGYYAKKMGLPIKKLICASNRNNILTDFFTRGVYNLEREFYKTTSPSMDILISSNLERLLFEISSRDDNLTKLRLQTLSTDHHYSITQEERGILAADFYADFANEKEVFAAIAEVFDEFGYIMDTHTAVAYCVNQKYKDKEKDATRSIILSTASPYKFADSVLKALDIKLANSDIKNIKNLKAETALPIPEGLLSLFNKPILHKEVVSKSSIKNLL